MENEITAHRSGKVDRAERRRGRRGLQRRRPRRHQVAAPGASARATCARFAFLLRSCLRRSFSRSRSCSRCSLLPPFLLLCRRAALFARGSAGVSAPTSWQSRPTQSSSRSSFACGGRRGSGSSWVADDVVELVRVLVDVVELFLAVRPLDVLVGAEADSLVVLRRRHDRGAGAVAAACRRALALAGAGAAAARRGRRPVAGGGAAVLLRRRWSGRRTRRGAAAGCAGSGSCT